MAISHKTRKLLWGISANRCAICKQELTIGLSPKDSRSIIGEECHIISPKRNGPRWNQAFPLTSVDSYENLILLCAIHHKMIDDQPNTYDVNTLQNIKTAHESWVSQNLAQNEVLIKPLRIKRITGNIPKYLPRLSSGQEILNVLSGACAFEFGYDELISSEEVNFVSSFIQTAQDFGELAPEWEAGERIQNEFLLNKRLRELEESGYFVFGIREMRIIEGGISETPGNWPVAHLYISRKTSDNIMNFEPK